MEALILDAGNGFPEIGDFVEGNGSLWRIVAINGVIHARQGSANFMHAKVEEADYDECAGDDVFPAGIEFDDD